MSTHSFQERDRMRQPGLRGDSSEALPDAATKFIKRRAVR